MSKADLQSWVGRRRESRDLIAPFPAEAFVKLLDMPAPAPGARDPLPPGIHWIYFLEAPAQDAIGPDGHPKRGDFLPPVPLPRRMWAGGRLWFKAPLRVGDEAVKVSTVKSVAEKEGRTGPLVFVTVEHRILNGAGEEAVIEEHDIVYREAAKPGAPAPKVPPPPVQEDRGPEAPKPWRRAVTPDEPMLFRYSALTYNGHRIHYDHPYATGTEGYGGIVVHGPLLATFLIDLCGREADKRLARFAFRARQPVTVDGRGISLKGQPSTDGRTAKLWIETAAGGLAMEAEAGFE